MNRCLAAIVLAAAVASGCRSQPPDEPPDAGMPPVPESRIVAVSPADRALEASRRPTFEWRLPPTVEAPRLVSFTLAEAGNGPAPVEDEARQKRLAFASGLHSSSPTGIDPWDPPAGCVLTGDLTDLDQLSPQTWHRWSVRAVSDTDSAQADFYFRTRAHPATPGT